MTVYGEDVTECLPDHFTIGIHAEGPHPIIERLGIINELCLVGLVCQLFHHHSRKLHPDTKVHRVGVGIEAESFGLVRHPGRTDPSWCCNDKRGFDKRTVIKHDTGHLLMLSHNIHCSGIKYHPDLIAQIFSKVLQDGIAVFRSHMMNLCGNVYQACKTCLGRDGSSIVRIYGKDFAG